MFESCACFGQNEIKNENALESSLSVMFEYLITEQKTKIFYFGGVGVFDNLCLSVLLKQKARFNHIKLVLVKPAIKDFEKQINFNFDDVVEFTEKNEYDKMPLYSRDLKMAKNADFLVFYVEETSKNKAKKILEFAKNLNKNLVNMV
ncbi:MAG: hypothetical protein IJA23_03275 [Clostridia bacterium]|nr:hypothetical protein [Clostridia bacterium]